MIWSDDESNQLLDLVKILQIWNIMEKYYSIKKFTQAYFAHMNILLSIVCLNYATFTKLHNFNS